MKLQSAFTYCLSLTLLFATLTLVAILVNDTITTTFFASCGIVFLMILPACSTTK